jgi:DNA-binding MarR family transcriptional regulator
MAQTRAAKRQQALQALSERILKLAKGYQLQSRNRICRHGITVAQCYALESLVDRGGALVTELAAALSLDKSNASRTADALIDLGLARVVPVPGNARARRLVATRKGERLAARIAAEIEQEHRAAFAGFDAAQLDACERVLSALLTRS